MGACPSCFALLAFTKLARASPRACSAEARSGERRRAKGGTRTPMAFQPPDPKSGASASSATFAQKIWTIQSSTRVARGPICIAVHLDRMLASVAPCSFRNRSPTARIFIMACFAGMPTSMVNPAYRGIPSARRRFPARPPGACCEWPHSMRVQPPSARRARSTATVDSYRSKVICGWRMRAPDVCSSSGSQACDSVEERDREMTFPPSRTRRTGGKILLPSPVRRKRGVP